MRSRVWGAGVSETHTHSHSTHRLKNTKPASSCQLDEVELGTSAPPNEAAPTLSAAAPRLAPL